MSCLKRLDRRYVRHNISWAAVKDDGISVVIGGLAVAATGDITVAEILSFGPFGKLALHAGRSHGNGVSRQRLSPCGEEPDEPTQPLVSEGKLPTGRTPAKRVLILPRGRRTRWQGLFNLTSMQLSVYSTESCRWNSRPSSITRTIPLLFTVTRASRSPHGCAITQQNPCLMLKKVPPPRPRI